MDFSESIVQDFGNSTYKPVPTHFVGAHVDEYRVPGGAASGYPRVQNPDRVHVDFVEWELPAMS